MAKYTRSGVFEASLAVVQQWLSVEYANYGDGKLRTEYLRNATDLRSFGDVYKRKSQSSDEGPVYGKDDEKLVYPFLGLTVGQISPDEHRAGYKQKRFSGGQLIGKNKDTNEAIFESYAPVSITVGAILETDNFDHVISYAVMLFEARPRITLVLSSDDTGFRTEIGVQFDLNLTIPQSDSGTPGDPYRFEHTLTIGTYLGVSSTLPLIRNITVNAKVGTRTDETVMNIDGLPTMSIMNLKDYELFDRSSPNFKYPYKGA